MRLLSVSGLCFAVLVVGALLVALLLVWGHGPLGMFWRGDQFTNAGSLWLQASLWRGGSLFGTSSAANFASFWPYSGSSLVELPLSPGYGG